MIEAKDCSLQYKDGTLALKPFNLSIGRGETVFIMGPSGSGKTSLLKLMMGIEMPSQGTFFVLDQPMTLSNSDAIRKVRTQMGPVFQEFRLLEGRSVLDNVILSLRFMGYTKQDMIRIGTTYIERVGLSHKINHTVDRLSWGECQRVAIARAVARKPALIIADEPTGNLDHENALKVLNLLTGFVNQETTVIITTHATHLVDQLDATQRIFMRNGEMTVKRYNANE